MVAGIILAVIAIWLMWAAIYSKLRDIAEAQKVIAAYFSWRYCKEGDDKKLKKMWAEAEAENGK